jgi:hypothetical protein
MLMDYANIYTYIIYYHHMLVYLGFLGQVVGISFESHAQWWSSSNFRTRYDFSLILLAFNLYSILEIIVDFWESFRLLWFTPSHREIFLITKR